MKTYLLNSVESIAVKGEISLHDHNVFKFRLLEMCQIALVCGRKLKIEKFYCFQKSSAENVSASGRRLTEGAGTVLVFLYTTENITYKDVHSTYSWITIILLLILKTYHTSNQISISDE